MRYILRTSGEKPLGMLLVVCVLVSAVALTSGCNTSYNAQAKQSFEGNRVVVALFDLSGSTKEQRSSYSDDFKTIVDELGAGDVAVADKINENSLSKSSFPINQSFPTFKPTAVNDLFLRK